MSLFYFFGNGTADGSAQDKPHLGGKGANLAEMARLGLPIPAGFTLSTETCQNYYKNNENIPTNVLNGLPEAIKKLEEMTGKQLGGENPLLLSVRSGAAISMPGMMDTVLNLGLNTKTVKALAKKTGNARFAFDAHRRFLQMFGNVVLDVPHHAFEHELDVVKEYLNKKEDTQLTAEDWQTVIERYNAMLKEKGLEIPEDPVKQLKLAINAVFASWNNDRAIAYRRINGLFDVKGTAVNIQAMVFGNMGENSATGVAFTRNPSTGENKFFGEYLINAQGEDVVAGIRTPQVLTGTPESLEQKMPTVFAELNNLQQKLEKHYKDMQDIEFTIEEGELYLLQTRTGKRTARAMVKIATDMVKEGVLTEKEALMRINAEKINELMHPSLKPGQKLTILGKGLPASPGVAVGKIYFTPEKAKAMKDAGENVILVRNETSPEDIEGMHAADGILTVKGGMTSHAAVVARGMGRCCVCGCGDIRINEEDLTLNTKETTLKEGDIITLDGSTGEIYKDGAQTEPPAFDNAFKTILKWADSARIMQIRTNADTPEAANQARNFGAEGIGLCRTEHMFFEGDRIRHMRAMILSNDENVRKKALKELEKYQIEDFEAIFTAMDGFPVTVRLLDPPLHEFLPEGTVELKHLAADLQLDYNETVQHVHDLREQNPMLGLRGCRLGATMPEITAMQVRAILKAAIKVKSKGINAIPEIMVPLVGHETELLNQKNIILQTAEEVFTPIDKKDQIEFTIGTMIELPRACVTADEIAQHADFFSFGTNDLTQTTLGLSRDDAGKFLPKYIENGLLKHDPFVKLDQNGVGFLVEMGIQMGRAVKPDLKCGICGEHGGDPDSIAFCAQAGLNYVSCSPFRVPVARVALAQAAIQAEQNAE